MRSVCPNCQTIMQLSSCINSDTGEVITDRIPEEGDISVCSGCLAPLKFGPGKQLIELTQAEVEAMSDGDLQSLLTASLMVRMHQLVLSKQPVSASA